MTRLIDADDLIKKFLNCCRTDFEIRNCCMTNENVIHIISNAPTVEERPHGEWIKKIDDVGFVSYICSECGFELELEDCSDSYYCSNCGADMREADNDKSN